jgi:hypothetical protein
MLENLKKKIQYDIANTKSLKLHFGQDKDCDFFPHRLVYLDGILCVIGEDIHNKILKYFPITEIKNSDELNLSYEANFSQIEISEFINESSLISGKQVRLIIKFHASADVDVLPAFHYLHNPYTVTNGEGDMIWAATIEMCEDIFLWLYQMRDKIEILDPGPIRKDFAHFCEFQKAS